MLRFGIVSTANPEAGTVSVIVPGKEDNVSEQIPLLDSIFKMPKVGDKVACVFEDDGLQEGVCLGRFFNQEHVPGEILVDWDMNLDGDITTNKATTRDGITCYTDVIVQGSVSDGEELGEPPEYPG